jgi:curved DNA-binding protein CbpA
MKDYYGVLGLDNSATDSEIKRAYRRLAVLYHPDKNSDPAAEQFFKEVNEAYEVLGDPEKRRAYDYARQNPFATLTEAEQRAPYHRDPAYRRRRPGTASTSRGPSRLELMKEYLPYFRWLIYFGLLLMIVFAVDYSMPTKLSREKIVEEYTVRVKGVSYAVIVTENREIKIYHWKRGFNIDGNEILVEYTPLLRAVINIARIDKSDSMHVGGIYSTVIFLPLMLFIASIAGLIFRSNIEYAFNLSIVAGVLIVFVIYLIFSS